MGNGNALDQDGLVLVGKSQKFEYLTLKYANRHGLVTGATGTGKTVTLQTIAEGLSARGICVFAADIKGDLSGISQLGDGKDVFVKRCAQLGLAYQPTSYPTVLWDLFGIEGHPVRTTVEEMGALLLARLLQLNDTQTGVLNILFTYAAANSLPLIDLADLRAMLAELGANKELQREIQATYGNVSAASVGAIQRQMLVLENQGGAKFFGAPALEITDFLKTAPDGRGTINLLAADRLMGAPLLYATFLLWMLNRLFTLLPEVGDLPQPKLVFFFDEAHLLFDDAPKPLLAAIERVVRLIRSKGVGVYFVTQNPLDVPDTVLGQLGNRVQHALRAFTPRDQKAVQVAATTFRQNPAFKTADVITQLGVGEALVSMLQADGTPEMVQRSFIKPPFARVGPVSSEERAALIAASVLEAKYAQVLTLDGAAAILKRRAEGDGTIMGQLSSWLGGAFSGKGKRGSSQSAVKQVAASAAKGMVRSMARQIGSALIKSLTKR